MTHAMSRPTALAALLLVIASPAALAVAADPPAAPATPTTPATPATTAKPAAPPIYDESADAAAMINAALAKAARNNTRVLVQWGANWCGWCKLLHGLCKVDPAISRELLYEYEVVLVDVGRFDKAMDLAAKYDAKLKDNGIPYLTVLDANGKVLANQETGSLEKASAEKPAAPAHDPAKVLAFLKQHQATAPAAELVLKNGLARAAADKKVVFLHFGAPWCGWCHKLEDWMARPDVNAILSKAFIDVKIDTDRMAGGQAWLTAETAKTGKDAGGIPWFEFLKADGTVIATSTAPAGNVGFPAQPEEIQWFMQMVQKAAPSLSATDLESLKASLAPKSK